MKTYRRGDVCLVLCGVLIWLLSDAPRVRQAASEGLALCAGVVIPALFPFMVVSSLLVSLGFGQLLAPRMEGFMSVLFRLPGCAGSALLLGLIGGYPIGARTAAQLYRARLLTHDEAQRLLTFCNNSSPVFFLSIVGQGVFGSLRVGLWLWLVHLLSALLTGLLLCRGDRGARRVPQHIFCQSASLSAAFVDAVRTGGLNMLCVCAFVVVFYVLSAPLRAVEGLLPTALIGLTELFSLTPLLCPDMPHFLLCALCGGWGGLSVLCQSAAVLDDTDLSLRPCLRGKAVQGVLSLALAVPIGLYLGL